MNTYIDMEQPPSDICSRPDKGGNPAWETVLKRLETGGLATVNRGVAWTPFGRLFIHHFLAKANTQREQYGHFELNLWNGAVGKFRRAGKHDISRLKDSYKNGTPRFSPLALAEYIFQLNQLSDGRAGDRLLTDCLVPGSFGPLTERTVVFLDAVMEGVRAGGRVADRYWASYQEDPPNIKTAIESKIRAAIDGKFAVKPKWQVGRDTKNLQSGDIVIIADAIDGYRMYKRRLPYWCIPVGMASYENDALRPILGVIFHPPTQEMFIGVVGIGGLLINERLSEFQVLTPVAADPTMKAVIASHFSVEKPEKSLPLLTKLLRDATAHKDSTERVLLLGSGQLALAYVAAQRAQVFINATTPLRSAFAGATIVEAIFGKEMVTDLAGEPWTFRSSGIIAWAGLAACRALRARVEACIP